MATSTKSKKKSSKTKAKKGTAKKPAKKSKDPVEELEEEISEDLGTEFDFEPRSRVGKKATFQGEDGETLSGVVVEDGDEGIAVKDDESGEVWEADLDDLTFVDGDSDEGEDTEEDDDSEEEVESGSGDYVIKLIPVASIKDPSTKARVREVDKESEKYQLMLADIKRRGIRMPLEVTSFKSPTLIDGAHRREIADELGFEEVPCIENPNAGSNEDRLWEGLLSNEMRKEMHWTELASCWARLQKGEYNQRRIAKAFGVHPTTVSRMIAALKLPKRAQEIATSGVEVDGKKVPVDYGRDVFLEMVGAPKKAQTEIVKAMESGEKVTVADVRALKKEHADPKDEGKRKKPKDETGTATLTSKKLPGTYTGDFIKIKVTKTAVFATIEIPHDNKTFRGFDIVEEIRETFEGAYQSDPASEEEPGCEMADAADLAKALRAARAELA